MYLNTQAMGARLEEVLRLRTTHEELLRLLTREEVSYSLTHFCSTYFKCCKCLVLHLSSCAQLVSVVTDAGAVLQLLVRQHAQNCNNRTPAHELSSNSTASR
jgi:hypothetical protein